MNKLQRAIDFLEQHGQILLLNAGLLKQKVGLKEIENPGKNYKIFVKADPQMRLNL